MRAGTNILQRIRTSESRTYPMNFLLNVSWAQRQCMHACDAFGVCLCFILSLLATYHLDDGMGMSVETVWDSNQ